MLDCGGRRLGVRMEGFEYTWQDDQLIRFVQSVHALTNLPFYVDLACSHPNILLRNRKWLLAVPDFDRLFYEGANPWGFNVTFDLLSARARKALSDIYRFSVRAYRDAGVTPWAYKIFNEPTYCDDSRGVHELARQLAEREGRDCADAVDLAKIRERAVIKTCNELRDAINEVDSQASTFVQVHNGNWCGTQNGFYLYGINRRQRAISVGTGSYNFSVAEDVDAGCDFARAPDPSNFLANNLASRAFYRAMADGKPLLASESYIGGFRSDRSADLRKMIWHEVSEGAALCNIWEWGPPFLAKNPQISYVLCNPCMCYPSTWDELPRTVKLVNELGDFFLRRERRPKAEMAVVASISTLRAEPERAEALIQTYAGVALTHVPVDIIHEEQIEEGEECRLERYRVIVVPAVSRTLKGVNDVLYRWVENGGTLVLLDGRMDADEHGRPYARTMLDGISKADVTAACGSNVLGRVRQIGSGSVFCRMEPVRGAVLALALRRLAESRGCTPLADVRDAGTSGIAPFVKVLKVRNDLGQTGWYFVNYTRNPRLLKIRARELADASAIDPIRRVALPVSVEGEMLLSLPPQDFAVVISGLRKELEIRLGAVKDLSADEMKVNHERMVDEARKSMPIRQSHPIDLRRFANYGFDNQQGWVVGSAWQDERSKMLQGVPFHGSVFKKVNFDIIRFDYNENRTCLALNSKNLPDAPKTIGGIPLSGQFGSVAFLLAVTHGRVGAQAMSCEFVFEDGGRVLVPLTVGREVGDWRIADNSGEMQNHCVWRNSAGLGFFMWEWENPRPSVPLASVNLISACGDSVPIVVAMSALPTIFTKHYERSIDLFDAMPRVRTRPPEKASMVRDTSNRIFIADNCWAWIRTEDGKPLPIPSEMLPNAVLRFKVRQGRKPNGEYYPVFGAWGWSCEGLYKGCPAQSWGRLTTNSAIFIRTETERRATGPQEWLEVEIPLKDLILTELSDGRKATMTDITGFGFHLNSERTCHELRELRVEWTERRLGK